MTTVLPFMSHLACTMSRFLSQLCFTHSISGPGKEHKAYRGNGARPRLTRCDLFDNRSTRGFAASEDRSVQMTDEASNDDHDGCRFTHQTSARQRWRLVNEACIVDLLDKKVCHVGA